MPRLLTEFVTDYGHEFQFHETTDLQGTHVYLRIIPPHTGKLTPEITVPLSANDFDALAHIARKGGYV